MTNVQSASLEFKPDMEFPGDLKDMINNSTASTNNLQQNQSDTQKFVII